MLSYIWSMFGLRDAQEIYASRNVENLTMEALFSC